MQRISLSTLFVLLTTTLLSTTKNSQAQVFEESCTPDAGYTLFEGFHYQRCGIPDFDQKRSDGYFDDSSYTDNWATGLENEGRMYCVPAATLNIMAYLADRGADFVEPGPGFTNRFPDKDLYQATTDHIDSLGSMMNTNSLKGTKGSGWKDGVDQWLANSTEETGGYNLNLFFSRGFIADSSKFAGPSPELIAQHGAQGSLILINVEWMEERVSAGGDHLGFKATGGHMVTVTAAYRGENGFYTIRFNDPADDGVNSNQSTFRQRTFATEQVVDNFDVDRNDVFNPLPGVRYKVIGYGSSFLRLISHITPKFGIFPDPLIPGNLSKISALVVDEIDKDLTITSEIFRDFEIAPFGALHAALRPNGTVVKINSIDGSITELLTTPGAKKLAYDNLGRILVLTEGGIIAIDQEGKPLSRTATPIAAESIAFDPSGGRIVAFDRADNQLLFLDNDLLPLGSLTLPATFLPTDSNIPVRMNINSKSGSIALLADGNPRVLSISFPAGAILTEEILLGDGSVRPAGLVADEHGIFYVLDLDTGRITAFGANGAPFPGAPFVGIISTPDFRILQSMDIGEWNEQDNQLPEDAPSFIRSLQLVTQSNIVLLGNPHTAVIKLEDSSGKDTAGRTLKWELTGANAASGTVVTDDNGTVRLSWLGENLGQDDLLVYEDSNYDSLANALEPSIVISENTVAAEVAVLPTLSVADISKAEGTLTAGRAKVTPFTFDLSLSVASANIVKVTVNTVDQTATSRQPKQDFIAIENTVITFQPGETTKQVTVMVGADTFIEADETFLLQLTSVENATLARTEAVATIINDDRDHPKHKR